MATVEEIMVKFNGDATSLVNASDKARFKTKDMADEMVKLDRIMEKAKKGTHGYEMTLRQLETTTKKYAETLDKLSKQDAKTSKPGMSGGGGGRISGATAGAAAAATAQLFSILEPQLREIGNNAGSSLEQLLSGAGTSLIETQRIQAREDDRAGYLSGLRGRGISDRDRSLGRTVAGRDNQTAILEMERQRNDTLQRLQESRNTINHLEKTVEENDSVLSRSKKAIYEQANAALKEEVAYYKQLEAAAHAAGQAIKDAQQRAWQDVQNQRQQLTGTGANFTEQALLLNNPLMDGSDITMMRQREAVRKRIQALPNETQENKDKMIKNELEPLERQYELLKQSKKEATELSMIRSQESKIRGFGRDPAEQFILDRNAEGRPVDDARAREMLKNQDKLTGAGLKENYMDPFRKAGREINKLNRLYQEGAIDAVTYSKALADVAKQTDGVGRASQRAAVETGSAESLARIDEYLMVQRQPEALSNQVERAMNQPPDGFIDPEQKKHTELLEAIRSNTKPKNNGVPMAPANLGGV